MLLAALYCVLVMAGTYLYITTTNQRADIAALVVSNRDTLCAFRRDLVRRHDSTAKFLNENPGKEPIPGISRADLRRSLSNLKATISSFNDLDCPKE